MIPLGENEKLHSIHVVRFADGSGFKLIRDMRPYNGTTLGANYG